MVRTIAVLFTQRFSAVNDLGHESRSTTRMYLEAYLHMKTARVRDPSRTAEYRRA